MRLLVDRGHGNFGLEEYHDDHIPRYAILSHTWGADGEEVTFKDLMEDIGKSEAGYKNKAGYGKMEFCRNQAAIDETQHFWVDTCCIDKSSSTELSEAINSMHHWYKNASKCYVYLPDVSTLNDAVDLPSSIATWEADFRKSRWFSRGWTLQELVAPTSVEFFSREGNRLGSKELLSDLIHDITGIPIRALRGEPLTNFEVEERMSWAKYRQTKRQEDKAYSLLGIFNVFMPLIYGEGNERAFARLRKEIGDGDKRKQVLTWLSEIDYRSHHEELSKNLLPGSGQWLLETDDYIEWGQSSRSAILWLHGIPGSGKTRLVATVIQKMTSSSISNTSPIAYFYCARSSAEPERAKPVQVLKAVLRQLASSKPDLPIYEPVTTEYEARKQKADDDCSKIKPLTVSDCVRLILKLTVRRSAVIFVDALDECEESLRHELLEALDEIVQKSTNTVKIFVSSRDDIDIKLYLEHAQNILVSADRNSADIAKFVESEVDQLISRRLLLDGNVPPWLKVKVTETLKQRAQGMFRWVALSLETLQTNKFRPDFEQALGALPTKLAGLYEIIYEQIRESGPNGYRTTVATLKWLLCAQRLMKTHEIIAAVSVELHYTNASQSHSGESSSDEEIDTEDVDDSNQHPLVSCDDIIRLCRNLVVLDTKLDVFRLAHQSVQEYLQRLPEYNTTNTHTHVAEKCIDAYLSSRYSCLKMYSRIYWSVHLKFVQSKLSPKLKKKVLQFVPNGSETSHAYISWSRDICSAYKTSWDLQNVEQLTEESRLSNRIFAAAQSHPTGLGAICAFGIDRLWTSLRIPNDFDWDQASTDGNQTLLHIAAEQKHEEVVKLLLAQKNIDVDPTDEDGQTPLSHAAASGSAVVVKLLLENGAELESMDTVYGLTPLSWAAKNGHEAVVKLFLKKDVELESRDVVYGQTPLSWAAESGHGTVVKLLLKKGAELESSDIDGQTPLSWAAVKGHDAVVKLLLDKSAALESRDNDDRTPLSWAAENGHEAVVKLLLEYGADPESRDTDGQTPLWWAFENRHPPVIKLLVEQGATLEFRRSDGKILLWWTAENGHETMMKLLLLKKGAALESKNSAGQTLLWWAAENEQETIAKLLLTHGAALESQSNDGQTLLSWAAINGREWLVKLLLTHNAALESRDIDGWTPLWWAAKNGHEMIMRLLLKHGAAPESRGRNGQTLLSWVAAANGREAVLKLLLEHSAALESQGSNGQTPLSWAAVNGREVVVKLLLKQGAALESRDNDGRTPLWWAAKNGHETIMRLLLKHGAALESVDNVGLTPMSWAAENGHEAMVKLLIEHGAALESTDKHGRTPMWSAAQGGHMAVVKLLLEHGAALESMDNVGLTPMSWAAQGGHTAVVKLLLEHGAALESVDNVGLTPMSWAAENGHEAMVKLLIEHGAALESTDKHGRTPMWSAAQGGHTAVVKLLLEHGAALESVDNVGLTPMSWAAENGHEAMVELLIEHGAALESMDNVGLTPMSWAAQGGHTAVVKLLLEHGAALESMDDVGLTPMSWAAQGGHMAVVKLLLEHGAALESTDKHGRTPMSRAAQGGHTAVVKLLLEHGAALESMDNVGLTPMWWAAQGGHTAVMKLLAERGAA